MPPRSKKQVAQEFPPETCGVCAFFAFEDDKHEVALCWADPPVFTEQDENGTPVFSRGTPIDPTWPKCRFFSPRMHA